VIALSALVGALIAGGLVAIAFAVNNPPRSASGLSTRLWKSLVDRRSRPHWIRLLVSAGAGLVAAAITGWPLLVALVPAAGSALPTLLTAPPNRELDLLQAIDRWVRTLGSLLPTGRSIADAIRVSTRQAPALIAPQARLLAARLDDRWTIEQALNAMADELDSPDADAVLAALALVAQRGGTGAGLTLSALADNLQDRLRALREISTERAKPRFVVRQVTLITTAVLGVALLFGGDFFAPFGTPLGQVLLTVLVAAYLGSLLFLRRMTLPRPRQRILTAGVAAIDAPAGATR
jgi:Flp pilus assembly protein TadB